MNPKPDKHSVFSQEIVDRIKSEDIRPRSRLAFLLPRIAFWVLSALAVFLWSRVVVVIFLVIFELGGDLPAHLPPRAAARGILETLPLLWIIVVLLTIIVAVVFIRYTPRGYRFPVWRLVGINLAITVMLGGLLYALGDRPRFEQRLADIAPGIRGAHERYIDFWSAPEEGRIIGKIREIHGGTLLLRTKEWDIHTVDIRSVESTFKLWKWMTIRVVGLLSDEIFEATEILPEPPLPRGFFRKPDFFERNHMPPAYEGVDMANPREHPHSR